MKRYVPNFRPPSKYRAQKTTVDGIAFDSKAEAARYQQLKQDKRAGKIRWFTRQPSFILPGGHRYRPDFMVCEALCGWRMSRALRQRDSGSNATFGGRLLGASRSGLSKTGR